MLTRFRNRFPDVCRGLLIVDGSQVGDITDEGVLWQWVGISDRDMASRQLDGAGVQAPARSRADIEAECQPNDAAVQALGAGEPEESAAVAALFPPQRPAILSDRPNCMPDIGIGTDLLAARSGRESSCPGRNLTRYPGKTRPLD